MAGAPGQPGGMERGVLVRVGRKEGIQTMATGRKPRTRSRARRCCEVWNDNGVKKARGGNKRECSKREGKRGGAEQRDRRRDRRDTERAEWQRRDKRPTAHAHAHARRLPTQASAERETSPGQGGTGGCEPVGRLREKPARAKERPDRGCERDRHSILLHYVVQLGDHASHRLAAGLSFQVPSSSSVPALATGLLLGGLE